MDRKSMGGTILAAILAAALVAGHAQAQQAPEGDKPAKSKSKKAAKHGAASGSGKVTIISGSGETTAQRTARLKRECKGAVDAGACTGYTR